MFIPLIALASSFFFVYVGDTDSKNYIPRTTSENSIVLQTGYNFDTLFGSNLDKAVTVEISYTDDATIGSIAYDDYMDGETYMATLTYSFNTSTNYIPINAILVATCEYYSDYGGGYTLQSVTSSTIDLWDKDQVVTSTLVSPDYTSVCNFSFKVTFLDESTFNTVLTNNSGYDNGYRTGYDTGLTQGYNNGYTDGVNSTHTYTFASLFGAIADTPIMILRNLLNFDVFGVNAMIIFMSMITGCIAIFLIRKFLF